MQTSIEKALKCLENADYAGYFEEMDKVEMPKLLRTLYAEHKSKFMQGLRPFDFAQQLTVFASQISKNSEEKGSEDKNLRFLTSPPFMPPVFVGREKELHDVHTILFEKKEAENPFLMLVNGQGGIGKTTFAARYWEKYQQEYHFLAFFYVENGIANALLSLSLKLGLRFTTETQPEQLRQLVETLASLPAPALLILDNANHEKDLDEMLVFLRKCPNFHILLTSRLADCGYSRTYSLGTLDKKQALELFQTHYPSLEATEIPLFEEIYTAVGGNTLVLELLAKNLSNFNRLKKRYPLSRLREDLQKSLVRLSHSQKVRTEYQAKGTGLRYETPKAIILAMYDLTELSEAEKALLSVFAVLPAENIEFEILSKLLQDENIDMTLLSLAQKGWIEQTQTAFKCSPVVQGIVGHTNQSRLLTDCGKMIDELNEGLNYIYNPERFHQENYKYATLYSHYAESVMNVFTEPHIKLSILLERIGKFHETIGNLSQALDFYEKKNNVCEKLVSQNPENSNYKNGLAISYEKLGNAHSKLGNLEEALAFFEKYKQLENELYEAYPANVRFKNSLAISYEKLGQIHSELGNLEQALAFFEKYSQLENELYEAYPANVEFKNNLAISYEKLGQIHTKLSNLEEALDFFEKDVELTKELYEAYPSNVSFKNGLAISYEKLGQTHSKLGNLEEALAFFEKETQLFEELYKDYPANVGFKNGLAVSYEKLGQTHSKLGNLEEALDFFEKETQLFEELYISYPSNVSFKNNLAISYAQLGDFYKNSDQEKAKMYYEECKKLWSELVQHFPAYVEFRQNLALVEKRLQEW